MLNYQEKDMQNQDALPGIVILGFFFFYCLAGIVSYFHRLSIVNAADNQVGSKIVIPLNLFEIPETFLFSIVAKEK